MLFYLQLQAIRLQRLARELGVHPFLGLLLLTALFTFASVVVLSRNSMSAYYYASAGFLLVLQNNREERADFLRSIYLPTEYLRIRILENTLTVAPFVIFLTCFHALIPLLLLLIGLLPATLLRWRNPMRFAIPTPFYHRPYEFIVGFRYTFPLLLVAYFGVWLSLHVHNFYIGLAMIPAVSLLCLLFYSKPEEPFFVWIYAMNARRFLRKKMMQAVGNLTIINLPIMLTLMIWQPDHCLWVLGAQLLGCLFMILAVLAKYASYPEELSIIKGLLLIFSIGMPALLIVTVPYFYRSSLNQLELYLE